MKTLLIFCLLTIGCATPNVVKVCSDTKCATGFYNDQGNIETSGHSFKLDEQVEVNTSVGYSEVGYVRGFGKRHHSMYVVTQNKIAGKTVSEYVSIKVGDRVTVVTLRGNVRMNVLDVRENKTLILKGELEIGDSGAPVFYKSKFIGTVWSNCDKGVKVAM